MPSKKSVIKSYVSADDYARIAESASRAGIPMSAFVRQVCLGNPPRSRDGLHAVKELLHVNADLGRLGGLLKLWLSEPDRNQREVRMLLHELEAAKAQLAAKIMEL